MALRRHISLHPRRLRFPVPSATHPSCYRAGRPSGLPNRTAPHRDDSRPAPALPQGWRWAFILTGLPGILHSFIISFTVSEPAKVAKKRQFSAKAFTRQRLGTNVKRVLQPFANAGLIALTAAAAVRTTGG